MRPCLISVSMPQGTMTKTEINWFEIFRFFAMGAAYLGTLVGALGILGFSYYLVCRFFGLTGFVAYLAGWSIMSLQILNIPLLVICPLVYLSLRKKLTEESKRPFRLALILNPLFFGCFIGFVWTSV